MRYFIVILVAAAMSVLALGCASHKHAECGCKSETQPEKKLADPAGHSASRTGDGAWTIDGQSGIPCVMQSGGRDVLRLTTSADTKCKPRDGALDLVAHEQHLYFWMVKGANTVTEAAGRVPQEIKDEFKDFKADKTKDLPVAGSTAKRMMGSGTEADDGDPGHADVIVFKAGDNFFIACVHGEHLAPADQQWMQTVVQSAQAP